MCEVEVSLCFIDRYLCFSYAWQRWHPTEKKEENGAMYVTSDKYEKKNKKYKKNSQSKLGCRPPAIALILYKTPKKKVEVFWEKSLDSRL